MPKGNRPVFGAKSTHAEVMKTKDATSPATVDGGTVCGYAATFDREPDCYGDVVAKGAFIKTLAEWEERNKQGRYIPLMFAHRLDEPMLNVGRVTLAREDERGLYVEAEFDADNETAQYVRKLVKEGRLYQFSFAYHIRKSGEVELDGGISAYELQELDLLEVSLVQVPANRHAEVTEVKSAKVESKAGRRNSKADEDELRGILGKLDEVRESIVALIGDETDESEGGKADDTTPTKDDANGTGEKSTEGDEGKAMPEGHEVDESARVEAYRAALLAGLSNR